MKKTHSGWPRGIGGVEPFSRLKGCDCSCSLHNGRTCVFTVCDEGLWRGGLFTDVRCLVW